MSYVPKCITLLFFSIFNFTNRAAAAGIDKQIDEWFSPIADWWEMVVFAAIPFSDTVSIPLVLILLVCGGLFFTIYFRFVNFKKVPLAIKAIRGDLLSHKKA